MELLFLCPRIIAIYYFYLLVVDKAYKLLLEPEQKKRAVDVIQAGKEYVEHMVSVLQLSLCVKILTYQLVNFPGFGIILC